MKLKSLSLNASSREKPNIGNKPWPSCIIEFAKRTENGINPFENMIIKKTLGPEIGRIAIMLPMSKA